VREQANSIMKLTREARALVNAARENKGDHDTVVDLLEKVSEKLTDSRKLAGKLRRHLDDSDD